VAVVPSPSGVSGTCPTGDLMVVMGVLGARSMSPPIPACSTTNLFLVYPLLREVVVPAGLAIGGTGKMVLTGIYLFL